MKTFVLHLQSATQYERISDVVSFVGVDGSGSFGILAGHDRMITTLGFGLARCRTADDEWQYVAMPGAVLYFVSGELTVSTRRYLRGADYASMSGVLHEQLLAEEEKLREVRQTLARLEDEMLRHLQRIPATREMSP
jgi:F-type H+-transporting ATPase subunit epsilon